MLIKQICRNNGVFVTIGIGVKFDFNMAEVHKCITEERLQILIKKIFAEEFQKQEKNIINIISCNFEITMKKIKDLKAEVRDRKDSLEFTQNFIENEVEKLETKLDNLEDKVQDIWDYQIDPDYIQHKLIELEDRSRRNNIRIDGIEEEEGETWEISEAKATKVFKEKLGIEKEIIIERAHRTKRNYKDKDKKRPRTIVLRLANFKDKNIILKSVNKLKGSDVYINKDFSRETTELRKKLWEEVKQLR